MANLVLINGAPGSGKSTLASSAGIGAAAGPRPRHRRDPAQPGVLARRPAFLRPPGPTPGLAMARRHLGDGHDVVVGQYLARLEFIDELEAVARQAHAHFIEIVARGRRLIARGPAGRPRRGAHPPRARGEQPAGGSGRRRGAGGSDRSGSDGTTPRAADRRDGPVPQTLDAVRRMLPDCLDGAPGSVPQGALRQIAAKLRREREGERLLGEAFLDRRPGSRWPRGGRALPRRVPRAPTRRT